MFVMDRGRALRCSKLGEGHLSREEHKRMDPRAPLHPAWCRNRRAVPCQQRADPLPEEQSLSRGLSAKGMDALWIRPDTVMSQLMRETPVQRPGLDGKSQQIPVERRLTNVPHWSKD